MSGLTPKREKFAQELVRTGGQSEAYREAYPSSRNWKSETVHSAASRLAADGKVHARVEELRAAVVAQVVALTGIDTAWVVERSVEIVDRCMQAVMVLDRKGEPTGEWTFDSAGANKSLDRIAKRVGGFIDRTQVEQVNFGEFTINLGRGEEG